MKVNTNAENSGKEKQKSKKRKPNRNKKKKPNRNGKLVLTKIIIMPM